MKRLPSRHVIYAARLAHQLLSRFPHRLRAYPLLALALLLAGCNLTTPAPAVTTATAPATSTPTGALPAFSDWRLAYLGKDSRVHVVTQDGKTDLAGPLLTISSSASLWRQAQTAPNGRAFAYPPDLRVGGYPGALIDLRPGAAGSQGHQDFQGDTFFWSPDSTRLAFALRDSSTASNSWEIITLGNDAPTVIPGTQTLANQGELVGWIDTTHLAVLLHQGEPATSYTLSSLDVTSGALRQIAPISADGLGTPLLTISPDGSEALLTNSATEGTTSFAPIVELINTSTGQKRRLPNITSGIEDGFQAIAWKPGTSLVLAAVSGKPALLLDLAQDTATPFADGVIPLGWAPDTGTLFTCTQSGTNAYQVSTMAAPPPATAAQPVFSISSATLPFIGFVRTG
jgi:hypothetical protein